MLVIKIATDTTSKPQVKVFVTDSDGHTNNVGFHAKTRIRPCLRFFGRLVFVDCNNFMRVSVFVTYTIGIRLVYSVLWSSDFLNWIISSYNFQDTPLEDEPLLIPNIGASVGKIGWRVWIVWGEIHAPRAGDDVCTNKEDADNSAMAFSPPKLTSQPINDELTSDEVAESSTTISPSESYPSQITTSLSSFSCLNGVSQIHHTVLHVGSHTKFAPDCFFGLVKNNWHTKVETIGCIARVVESSSMIGANIPQLITGQSGDWEVLYYDWTTLMFLRTTSKIWKASHHITFSMAQVITLAKCLCNSILRPKKQQCGNEKDDSVVWFPPADCAWGTRPETVMVP